MGLGGVPGRVPGGVPGGVAGGVAGGVPGGVAGGVAGGGLGECVKTLSWNVVRVSNAVSLSPVNTVRLSTLEQVQPGKGEACCTP